MPAGPTLFPPFDPPIKAWHKLIHRIAALSVAASLVFGCATPPQSRQLFENPPDIPRRVELAQVPFFPQTEYHCGPAALASVISFRGVAVLPEQIASLVYVPELKGSLQAEVVSAARQFDLLPVPLDGRIESIMREIAAGNPIFALQNLGLESFPSWHYEVVVGYDMDRREMILRSGEYRRVVRSIPVFERTWRRAGHWALAVVPADAIPVTAQAPAYLETAIAMEQVGRVDSAHRAYTAASRRWPENVIAHSGVGNTAFATGEFDVAESAYRAALALEPERADVWNNLAYTLAAQGRHEAAGEAIQQALALDPENPNIRDSFEELVNRQ